MCNLGITEMSKVGVLVHGCHLEAIDRRHIVWGEPPNLLGRLPKAVHVAWRLDATKMIFGSGGSVLDGEREGTRTRKYLLRHFGDLMKFNIFADNWDPTSLKNRLQPFIEGISVVDDGTQNTTQEVSKAAEVFEQEGITDMILVSSPTHLPRCLRDACDVLNRPKNRERYRQLRQNLYATPSDTCYADSHASDVVVIEPPHRDDQTSVKLHPFAQRLVNRFYKMPEGDLGRKARLQEILLGRVEGALGSFLLEQERLLK